MSLLNALTVMASGHIVLQKDAYYTLIDERICICRYNPEEERIEHHEEISTPVDILSMLFDDFTEHFGINCFIRPPVPEFYVIEDGTLYDFSKLLEAACPVCQSWCGRGTVRRIGRVAHCPGCNRPYWKASRLDGTRDYVPPKEPKETKPKEPTNEEIIDSLLEKPKKTVKYSISF